MFNADYQWDDKKNIKTTYFFLIKKNYDFGGENMIMFFFRINQLPVVYSQENAEAT